MSIFRAIAELSPARIWDGVLVRAVHGQKLTVGIVDFEPGVLVPEHRHDNEQVGFLLSGSVTMVVAGESRLLKVGETYTINAQIPHSAKAGAEGATVVDVFAPVREDWKTTPTLKPFLGRWPDSGS